MSALTYDIGYGEERSRLTNAFRLILAFPHLVVVAVWAYFVQILAFVQWFIILFTGRRNQALWDLQWAWLGYAGRVNGYANLMFDPYPVFGTAPGPVPVTVELRYEEPADRLTNGLRFIWAIPALLFSFVIGIGLSVVVFIAWFVIVISGKHPRGFFDFSLRVLRYTLRVNSYVLLMTDTYPKWEPSDPAQTGRAEYWTPSPGGDPGASSLPPPPGPPPGAPPVGGPLPPP